MIDINELWDERNNIRVGNGIRADIFEWISSMVPIPNVDLLIFNKKGQVLLSWRDDEYYGQGWHIPGGCIRFKETIADRIQKTALEEIGSHVEVGTEPIVTREMIMNKDDEYPIKRAHHIALLYECHVPDGYVIDNGSRREDEAGYLKWFDSIPDNILGVHDIFNEVFVKYGLM